MAEFVLDDLVVHYLVDAGIGLVFGTNLFAGILPDAPDMAVMVTETSGQASMFTMGNSAMPVFEYPGLQVIVRGERNDYLTARSLIHVIWKLLSGITNQDINTNHYFRVEDRQPPFLMHRDDQRRPYFSVNFDVTRVPTP